LAQKYREALEEYAIRIAKAEREEKLKGVEGQPRNWGKILCKN